MPAIRRDAEAFHADHRRVPDQLALGGRINREPRHRREVELLVLAPGVHPFAAVGGVLPERHRETVGQLPQAGAVPVHDEDLGRPGNDPARKDDAVAARREPRHGAAAAFAEDDPLAFAVLGVEAHQDELVAAGVGIRAVSLHPDDASRRARQRAELAGAGSLEGELKEDLRRRRRTRRPEARV